DRGLQVPVRQRLAGGVAAARRGTVADRPPGAREEPDHAPRRGPHRRPPAPRPPPAGVRPVPLSRAAGSNVATAEDAEDFRVLLFSSAVAPACPKTRLRRRSRAP